MLCCTTGVFHSLSVSVYFYFYCIVQGSRTHIVHTLFLKKYVHILTYSVLAYVNKQQNTSDFLSFSVCGFFSFYLTVDSSVCLIGILPEPVNIGLNIGQGSGIGPYILILVFIS